MNVLRWVSCFDFINFILKLWFKKNRISRIFFCRKQRWILPTIWRRWTSTTGKSTFEHDSWRIREIEYIYWCDKQNGSAIGFGESRFQVFFWIFWGHTTKFYRETQIQWSERLKELSKQYSNHIAKARPFYELKVQVCICEKYNSRTHSLRRELFVTNRKKQLKDLNEQHLYLQLPNNKFRSPKIACLDKHLYCQNASRFFCPCFSKFVMHYEAILNIKKWWTVIFFLLKSDSKVRSYC